MGETERARERGGERSGVRTSNAKRLHLAAAGSMLYIMGALMRGVLESSDRQQLSVCVGVHECTQEET